jgi:hypothetical protein
MANSDLLVAFFEAQCPRFNFTNSIKHNSASWPFAHPGSATAKIRHGNDTLGKLPSFGHDFRVVS